MISIIVQYKFSNLKVPVSPGTTLNEVLIASVKHFKLEGDYQLRKDGKPVELDLPWRLLNYTANSKFDLLEGSPVANNTKGAVVGKRVKIRFQVQGKGTIIKEIPNNEPFSLIMDQLCKEQQWTTPMDQVYVQFFSKNIKSADFNFTTLRSLGIESPSNIKVILGPGDQTDNNPLKKSKISEESTNSENIPEPEDSNLKTDSNKSPSVSEEHVKKQELHKPIVYLPPDTSISQRVHEDIDKNLDDIDYELTVDHAKLYQNMVAKQAGSLGGPLMTRRMREEQESRLKSNINKITECIIRIRFPDLTQIEVIFKADDTINTVYNVIEEMITNENEKFGLYQTHPHKKLDRSELKLVDDLDFRSKTILVFETEQPTNTGPFIKKNILENGINISNSIDPQLNQNGTSQDDDIEVPIKKEMKKSTFSSQNPQKIPKWLKLSKK